MMDDARVTESGGGLIGLLLTANVETLAVLVICLLFSLISWYIIWTKWAEFRRYDRAGREYHTLRSRSRTLEEREQGAMALARSPFAELVHVATGFISDLRQSNQRDGVARTGLSLTQLEALTMSLDMQVREVAEKASRWIPWLAVIATAAPLLGLLGTVLGIMQAFMGIHRDGGGNIEAVAPGIADALVATAAGLAAAIPAVIAYNLFTARVERLEGELERSAQEIIGTMGREGRL
jgi:biopolymer transport protein TolQ